MTATHPDHVGAADIEFEKTLLFQQMLPWLFFATKELKSKAYNPKTNKPDNQAN